MYAGPVSERRAPAMMSGPNSFGLSGARIMTARLGNCRSHNQHTAPSLHHVFHGIGDEPGHRRQFPFIQSHRFNPLPVIRSEGGSQAGGP